MNTFSVQKGNVHVYVKQWSKGNIGQWNSPKICAQRAVRTVRGIWRQYSQLEKVFATSSNGRTFNIQLHNTTVKWKPIQLHKYNVKWNWSLIMWNFISLIMWKWEPIQFIIPYMGPISSTKICNWTKPKSMPFCMWAVNWNNKKKICS
jgi:hypothetical protein